MENEIAIKIDYFVLGKNNTENYGEIYIDEFSDQIRKDYIVTFKKNAAERGAGHFVIEFLLNLTLKDYLMVILSGLAWDIVKIGTRKFFLRPFIEEYKKFREKDYSQEIRDITFTFSDTKLNVTSIHKDNPEVSFATISKIFQNLASNYNKIDIDSFNKLTDIYIPIFRDNLSSKKEIFRQKLSFDEPLEFETDKKIFTNEAYLQYWGLSYFNYERKIFNVETKELRKNNWFKEDEYLFHKDYKKK